MDLIALLVTVCTSAQPAVCDERRLIFSSDAMSLRSCMMQAQPYIAQYIGERPTLELRSWRCAPASDEKS